MKKSLAALGASVLGVGGALAATAGPADAAVPFCANATDHVVKTGVTNADNWYMSCIPQYGMGKAEFTITTDAAHPFPSDSWLTSPSTTATTSSPTAAQVNSYFEPLWHENTPTASSPDKGAFMNMSETGHSVDGLSQTYGGVTFGGPAQSMAYKITSVGKVSSLPVACTSDPSNPAYAEKYEVTYAPTTTTFSETVNNVIHKVTVHYTPAPLFLGLNLVANPDPADTSATKFFDSTLPQCASSGGVTEFAASDALDHNTFRKIALDVATNEAQFMSTLVPQPGSHPFVNSDPGPTVVGTFATTSTPVLAATGVDAGPAGLLGAGLLGGGLLAFGVGRRRRRTVSVR